ncbi:hypothetical protein JZU46_04410 [bacterium]|jgi:hypothetical protein|nr:hypothetical protein [bacterium]
MLVINSLNGQQNSDWQTAVILPIFILIIAFFSPVFAFALALLALIIKTCEIKSTERKLLGYIIVLTGAIIVSSREFGSSSDDLSVYYYPSYLEIASGNFSNFFRWGWGLEIGINIINIILAFALPKLTEPGYAFVIGSISGIIFVNIVENYLIQDSSPRKKAMAAAVIYAMYSSYFSTQLVRQFLSSLFLIVALFECRRTLSYLAIFAGSLFHLSILPIYVFFRITGLIKLNKLYLIVLLIIGTYYIKESFGQILLFLDGVFPDGRFTAYSGTLSLTSASDSNLSIIKYLMVGLLSIIGTVFFGHKTLTDRHIAWVVRYLFVISLYIILIDYWLFPLRASLLVHGLMLGWFLVMIFRVLSLRISMVISILTSMFIVKTKIFLNPESVNALWYQFELASVNPGYYLQLYFN